MVDNGRLFCAGIQTGVIDRHRVETMKSIVFIGQKQARAVTAIKAAERLGYYTILVPTSLFISKNGLSIRRSYDEAV